MDIKHINSALQNTRQNDAARKADEPQAKGAEARSGQAGTNGAEQVSVTDASRQAQALNEKARDVQVDNREKIEALKQAIAEGSYDVDVQAVAKKLLQTEALFSTL
ncbi:anti-sigma-28 factor, FlgM family [Sulfurivirga caldicuralii]|uniref:Negative regulator of flagellin synthesis n=1 Tax=Sulfurivirga caldicuralii TaxID=364032 RepID=A0A1N6E5H5_9GAMM|nr:flagellar biosynthesis anti-sigma factor FlgM [Sulfurivirga caldicuralii]SIN78177.1 anti-sigma-28 factor, FlgM family [Sulfurivirga caldicuralii]